MMNHPHPILNNVIKGAMFVAFFVAGLIYGYSINLNTMHEQQAQINHLEEETNRQQLQIDALSRHNEEAIEIRKTLEDLQARIINLEEKHKE